MIETLRREALVEADARQDEVLMNVLTLLSEPKWVKVGREVYENTSHFCSYEIYLPLYVGLKKMYSTLARKHDDAIRIGIPREIDGLTANLSSTLWQSFRIRDQMYINPCYRCSTCLGRKKTWPQKIQHQI